MRSCAINAAELNTNISSQMNAVKGMSKVKKPMTFHPKLCNVIIHDHPEFLYFSLYRGYVFWVVFFFLRKHFKSHRLTLCSFFLSNL